MDESLNSLRMRAERDGKHISGAERLIAADELETAAVELLLRAVQHPRGRVDRISIRVEEVPKQMIQTGQLPDLYNNQVTSWQQGRTLARQLLQSVNLSQRTIDVAMATLARGAAAGGNSMRGAMLIDVVSGERLEADPLRGVRASRMDLSVEARRQLGAALDSYGLNNSYVIEALTLAAKVLSTPGVVAELCWSDDPDYLAGYVAAEKLGYQRINLMKPTGEERGGRAFFVDTTKAELPALVEWLEKQPLLIERVGRIHPPRDWRDEA